MKNKITIATRSSKLALWQANFIKDELLKLYSDLTIELKEIKTKGDQILDVSLSKIGYKGLFTKEIEEAILNSEADIAVHSLKDLPTKLPGGLKIGAILNREPAHDVLLCHSRLDRESILSQGLDSRFHGNDNVFRLLPPGSKIGTSSLRRISQLRSIRPDLEYIEIRGNVDTRIKKLDEGQYDGIVLAYAGVKRLGFENRISYNFNPEELLPAIGQGALAIEIKESDKEVESIISKLNCKNTHLSILCERAFLRKLEGGCQVPIGAYTKINGEDITLFGLIASLNGKEIVRNKISGNKNDSEKLGLELAEMLLRNGGAKILAEIPRN